MQAGRKISKILTDYCENTSLVGLGYISNQKIHLTERIFWLICIVISAGGSYYLIREYQNTFESKAISLVIEGTSSQDKTQFPAIGICEQGSIKANYSGLYKFIKGLDKKDEMDEYNYNVEDFLLRIVFENMYISGGLGHFCEQNLDCKDCTKCPLSGYKEIAALVRKNCSELLTQCLWNGKPFQCCEYFLPLQTSLGLCFILNSIQTTKRDGPHWLKTEIGWDAGDGEMVLYFSNPVALYLLNPEDIPFTLITKSSYYIEAAGLWQSLQLTVENIINDPDVREVSPEYRNCKFPDENSENSAYDSYSFTTCVSDCLKKLQLQTCGCVSYNYLVKDNDKSPPCDYEGFVCLDREELLRPRPTIMQPWRSNGLVCKCLPSCTEHEIQVFQASTMVQDKTASRRATIRQTVANQRFRRQAVRSRLDVVVTIGGILGLFMGASILSAVEMLYFFLIRTCH